MAPFSLLIILHLRHLLPVETFPDNPNSLFKNSIRSNPKSSAMITMLRSFGQLHPNALCSLRRWASARSTRLIVL